MKAETETFEQYLINTKNKFVEVITKWFPHENSTGQNKEMRSEIRVACEDIIIAYDQLREKIQWIDVKKKLPEEHKSILLYEDKFKTVVYGFWNGEDFYQTFNGLYDGVTHWMPLPEKP